MSSLYRPVESFEVTSSGPRLQVSGFCDENRFHSFKQETSLTVRLLHSLKGKHDNIIFKLRSPEGDMWEKKRRFHSQCVCCLAECVPVSPRLLALSGGGLSRDSGGSRTHKRIMFPTMIQLLSEKPWQPPAGRPILHVPVTVKRLWSLRFL